MSFAIYLSVFLLSCQRVINRVSDFILIDITPKICYTTHVIIYIIGGL